MHNKKKILIVGLGIGKVYEDVLRNDSNYKVITIDPDASKNADYLSDSIFDNTPFSKIFDMTIICSPNFLHEKHIRKFAPISDIVLVEKPGVESSEKWNYLYNYCQLYDSNLIMVKNNMFRYFVDDGFKNLVDKFREQYKYIYKILLNWTNKNRIPCPGHWFTNKKLAFGGVTYDLLPHMIHFVLFLANPSINNIKNQYIRITDSGKKQFFKIEDIKSTDYGEINKDNPVYDVDDNAYVHLKIDNKVYKITIGWKSPVNKENERTINFNDELWNFDLCPNMAYKKMVDSIIEDKTEIDHYKIDITVLKIIENIREI